MKKKFVRLISAVLSAAMTLTAVPLSAFAEGEAHTHDGESNVITTPLDFREKTADENGVGWSWDHDTKTLTLNGVNIQATTEENMMSVVTVPDGTEIVLNGNNTIVQTDTGKSDTYVLSAVNNKEVNCDGTMTISGDGVLNAENRSTDSMARSLGGSIILNGGTVNATGTVKTNSLEIHNDGVLNANATTASFEGVAVNVSGGITVDGNGSLTAVGCANESTLNSAILLTSNFGDKISVSGNGSITVPEGNAARVGIYYSGNNGDGMDAEISGGKVTAYGAKYGIYKVNLIMSGTGSVYTTGGSYAIGQTVPTIDEDEFVVKGSTESKASESAVTGEVKLNGGYYEIDGADAKTVVIKPDTSPRIILGKQTGIFKTEEYEIIEGMDMTDTKLKGTVYFDITLKNMSDEEFADARGCFGGDEPDLSASIIKTDYGWVCMVYDTEFSTTYDTDNTLTIKCGDIVSNTVQVKSNANRFNKVTQGDNTNRTVFYTNTSQEEKDNYKLVSTYTVDSESISYNWYSTNSAYSADELGAAVSGSNGEFKLADNIPAGNYVLYCDITYSDGDSTETVTEKFTFTYKECAHENGYSDGKCTNCGALCDHSNIDIDTGKCNECGHQFVATISTDGSAPIGYGTLADCLNSVTADTENYVKIYQDIGDATATTDTVINVNHNVMIDLNGHKLNNIKLEVNKDVKLALTGTEGSYVDQVYVRKGGGSFIIDSEANVEFDTIFAEAGTRFTVSDGANVTVRYLAVKESLSNEGNATSVKLATGMKITEMLAYDLDNSSPLSENIMLKNLLSDNQMLKYESSSKIINLYYGATRIIINSKTYGYGTITVVEHTDADHKYGSGTGKCEECGKPCEHGGDINTDTGICSICGAVVSVAIYTDANGISKYVDTDELHSLLNEYNGSGTIKLFKDYSKPSAQYDLYGELTIDLNGRRLNIRSITPCKNGKLTIKNSGNPVMLGCNVYPTNDASYAGGTLIIDGDIILDTAIYVYDSSTVILNAGTYPAGLTARDSKTLYDMLGEGKAFFKTDGTLFNASVKEISSSVTLTVKDHSHTYVDGKCDCGYVCPHSDVDIDTGKCNECEYQYAAVIVKDGAVASVYEENEMGAAFEAADREANTGCTLKVYKNYTGSYTTLSGKFTLWIAEKANVGTLTVSGDITVTGSEKSNSFYGDFYVAAGGKLTFDKKCGAMGTVTVGAGTFDCYYSFVTTLNINDESSDVILHDGTFKTICYNGGGDRANAEILTLLAENRMFMKYPNAEPIDGSKTLLKDGLATVFVASHEDHSYDSTTGKCTICGKRCGHTDVDSKTGMCKTCQYEFVATLTVGDKVTGFDSLSDCLSKTSEDSENYVKIYKNIDDRTTINVNHTVTVDLNGHKLYYIELEVNNDNGAGNLTLTGSEGSYISQVDVCGGRTFKIDSDANINFNAIFVEAGARFEVSYGANVTVNTLVVKESLTLYGSTTTSVRLTTGMRIGTLTYDLDRNSGSGNLLLYSLLGEGKALQYDNSGEYVDIYEKFTSKIIRDSFTVVYHYEHSYDKATGKCVCGYVCPHSDVDSKTGVCSICEYQLTAGISSAGTAKYFDNIDDAFTAALSAENNGCTLTLYKDCELSQNIVIGNATLTVDVNGHFISPEIRGIDVNDGGVLYLKNSGENGSIGLEMAVNKGGTLINGTADDSSSAVSLFAVTADAAECVEFYGGSCTYLTIKNGTSGIALYGGYYDIICGSLTDNTPVNDLLAKGYAFATLNSVTHLPESIVDGSAKTIGEGIRNVTVVAHEHRYNVETGKCPCGVCALAIFTETTQSSETYTFIESETQFKNIAENEADGVLKLTGDVDCIVKGIIINGNKTIDMNGHTLNVSVGTEEISAVAVYGNVTFENSGSSRAVINATGVYSYGMVTVNGDIEFDTFATFEDGDALINAGVFKSIYVQGRSVIEILGSGKALASESGEILNASVQQIYKAGDNIFVTAHPKHTYDDHGNCACGYKCLHDGEGQVDEDSANKVCSECGAKIYAKVTTADGKVKYFDDITEGLRYADKAENKGCVFTLVTTGGLENDITLSSGQFTITAIDDNYINAYTRKINIKGAEITVENCAFNCFVGLYSGSLTYPEGSTSVCINGISVFGGTLNISDGVSENFGANKFTISDTATDAKVTIGGGIYGEIKLGQYTFKDILASGTRLISVEYSQETDEIIATNELLYSIVSEQNTLGVDDDKDYRFVKCDHKNEDGSYAFNEGGICKYCNSEFAASVSYTADGGEKTELFSDICDAFDKANEIGTATITLYKNIENNEFTREITVTGNVTLNLNGKTLGGAGGTNMQVSDGGTLTVDGDGDLQMFINVNENSKSVINGGELTYVRVYEEGNAEIKGGVINYLEIYGNAKISGGKFNIIKTANGSLESVLADGYAYKKNGGSWLSIAERAEKEYNSSDNDGRPVNVEEAPIKSASISWAGGEAPVIYRNGAKKLKVNVTCDVADTSKRITYSDFVNGNNRSKDSKLSVNWYMVFGYKIGEIVAEDGEVEYYTVLKCDGYEYKSNVLKLTLATCSHPEDSFTEKNNDGGVFCGICDLLIEAEVVDADGKSLGYAGLNRAIKLAQENEGSTVKLISERVPASITVTGGKFTVDFNGKEAYCQFTVNGGDVTFTSSAVQDVSNQNLPSGITVNGTDAKVTIDGKIKLGSVTLTSGTLTVNSTQGYIKELSINGGNAVIDGANIDALSINGGATVINGANIDALKTYGGDTVINDVNADSLTMCDNRSGGSEYNISIVSGMFGSFTCENGSNYTLGRAIASGSAVSADSMNGITVYTYEAIQTMTSTYRIFVDKCNHKDKNGSYVLDGNPCPYCNEEIVATVSYTANGGEETDLFSDIYDAFDKANEIGTATVTLYKDITDDITDTIAVTGNVTLELNGKKLSTSGFDPYYAIEVKSGKLTVNGSGTIKCVVVRNGGDAEINGGIFSDFRIEDGGNAVINGGKFNSIKVSGEGRNVRQLLADGHAYKNFDGFWSTVAEREKQDIANVEVKEAPIKSATITANDESPIIYRNGKKASTFAADATYSGNETLYITGCLIDGTVISEKTELLNGYCYLLGDQVDKVVAEDGEIQYYCIFTYDGYDYKSNVVTLTVATCQHPGESVKCDDNGCVCGICNRALPASVELSDGTLSYYENWNDAIGAAEESEGCTLKLLDYSGVNDGEIFDISKGRFTVDLNKNDGTTTFAFDVKGGDITFTASQEASSSLTGVTVSGENANVLIDSKATLNYLVVNSGKVSADGANIGAITINGGDTVINDVNADYLSMKADTTGGSGYNVSIVSGTFNIFTCENESNYTLGRAIASGSRVIGLNAIVGSGFKYAEIQSMTKANYLNVIKCDHKDANDSYALDGNLCPYCNEEIAATVSYTTANGGEMTDLFSDIYDAFAKANEVGTATITLYKDIENSELTQGVTITGNVTLALNGKKLGGTFAFNAPVEVSDGGMFTVGGDGKMRMPIKAYANSKLIINGGEFTSVMVYIDGDAEIGGGVIDALTIIGNAKAKISGGKFYNIEIANGSLESVLADGYAYKKDGGAWLSIAERAESVYSSVNNDNKPVNVEEAPIKSATLSTEINKLYRNSNANPTLKFNLALAHGSNLNDSYVSKRYGINSYVSGDIIYSSLSALVKDAKLSADEIIDKAGNSVAAKIYFVVITDDGYEIKSNTVSIDLVDCDHSQVVDPTADKETAGNITEPTYCEICESKFNAKITKGDDVKYYNDLDEAAKDAQKSENEGCTLYPLYNKNGYGGQLVITEGNFTLKYAVRTAFSRPIIINGKAKLTVTGRCAVTAFENQDAFIVRGGDVTFDGLATGSNVTINGGNVTMTANNINCLTINGGNVSISSGGFAEIITNAPNKVIADYIDPGFWVQDRGTKEWIDIYSLNKATASSTNGLTVRLCPMQIIKPIDTVYYTNGYYPGDIPSLQINAEPWYSNEVDAKVAYQWIAIDENGNETEIEGATDRKLSLENLTTGRYYCRITYSNATTAGVSMASDVVTATITECEHSGGEATCTNKAKCEICGAEYGETKPHSYAHIKAYEYLKSAATCTAKAVYYTSCTECGRSSEGTADEATFEYGNALGHKYGEWVSNGDGTHTRVCANDSTHTETKACHGGKATCTAKAICEVCGKAYGEMKPHSYTHKKSPEYLKSAATCTAKAVYYTSCADCGLSSKGTADEATFEYGNALGHKYGEWVSNGNGTHTRVCANDSTHIETKNCHGGKATCTAKAICEVCGKAYGEMTAHTFTAKSAVSRYLKKAATCTEKSEYYVSCAGCGLSSKGTKSEATFEGSALGHLLTQWNVTDASCTESGSEERHCTRCDYKQTQIIPAKGHTFGEWKITKNVGCVTDGEQTRECTVCGSKETKVIAATGVHVYGGWKVTKAPTCTTAGVKERTCAGCNAKETMTLQATGHKYTTSTVKPTYSAKGYTLYKCSLCGKSYKCNYTNMLVLPSVSGLKATSRTDKSITLGWNRNANATGYVIEYYNGAKWVKKSTVTKNTTVKYTVSSLKPGTVNKFRIRAYKATNYSAYSYITVNTLPSAVSGFKTVSKTSSTSTLRWNKNTSADGYIIERYIVNRWIQTQKVVGSGNVSTTIKSLTAGSTNKLRIRAYKTINKKTEYSSYTYLNVKTKPAQMTGLKAKSKTNNTVTLQWNKNATADSVFIEKYDGSKWVNVKKLSAGFTTYTVCKLSSGRTYRFRVRAYRAGEYSGYTYLNVNTRPYTTTGMKSKSVTKNSIVLQWNKNTSADGYSIEKYDGKKWVQVKRYTSNKSTTYTIKGLKARTTYKFRMRAYKTIGKVNEYSAYTYCNVTTAK